MFKNISSLEKAMRSILIDLNEDNFHPDIENNQDLAYAIYCCCEESLILNLYYTQNANGDYLFQKSTNTRISKAGLQFIKDTSAMGLIKKTVFALLKGIWGFLIGILGTLLTMYLAWFFGWI